jgi:hypothetical protein
MDEFQHTIAAERFQHFPAERRPSLCRRGRIPPQSALVEVGAPHKWSLASVRHSMRGKEIHHRVSTARFAPPSKLRFIPAALIQSP